MPWLSCIISNVALASLLALSAWVVQRRLKRPGVARMLWVLVLIKLVTPPAVNVPLIALPGPVACALGVCGCGEHGWIPTAEGDALPWVLLGVWSAGAAATLLVAWRRWARFRRLLAHATAAPRQWQALAARLSAELSLRRPPDVLALPGRLPPMVVAGWRRPRLLVPTALMGQLNRSQREALVLHELIHIQRGDHLVRLLELAVSVAFWWLPVVGAIGRRLRACEEAFCDAAVAARLPHGRRDYARLLLDVVDFADPLPRRSVPQVTAMSAADGLEQRLHAILDPREGTRRTWPAGAVALGLALAILPCGLHYELDGQHVAGGPTPTAIVDGCEPSADGARAPSADFQVKLSAYCCPS